MIPFSSGGRTSSRPMMIFALLIMASTIESNAKIKIVRNISTTLIYPLKGHTPFGIHRGTKFWLDVLTNGKAKFSDPQDLAVARLSSTDDPEDTTDDVLVTVWGLNSGRGEIIYNSGISNLKIFGGVGEEPGHFRNPRGIAADTNGRVLVADTGNNRVVELQDDGKRLNYVRVLAPGKNGPKLLEPTYCALDKTGGLYLSDTGHRRVIRLGSDGQLDRVVWRGEGVPLGLAFAEPGMDWFAPSEPLLYLVVVQEDGLGGPQLLRLDPNGQIKAKTNLPVEKAPFAAIDIDYYGNVYVVATGGDQILKYSPQLQLLGTVGTRGSGNYKFRKPTGIAIWRRFGQVFISEAGGAHYFWIGADARNVSLEISPAGNAAILSMDLTERALVTCEWIDRRKRGLEKDPALPEVELLAGPQVLDLPLPEQKNMNEQNLKLRIRLMATYSSRNRLAKELVISPR